VEYVADENGFHPQLSHPVQNTAAVERANERHFALYNKIAERNSDPNYVQSIPVPQQSAAVERETQRHANLYNKIAQQNSNAEYAQAVSQPRDSAAVGK
jgi:ribosomal protein S17